jgi:hypothetical protein
MNHPKTSRSRVLLLWPPLLLFAAACQMKSGREEPAPQNNDPGRCVVADVGEAADFIQSNPIVDDRMVLTQGLANPQALVWRNAETRQTFYLARIMGTERRLFYMRQVADDEKPGVASSFKGHLVKWQNLDPKRALPIANALKQQYNIEIAPDRAYVIIAGEKPKGCP